MDSAFLLLPDNGFSSKNRISNQSFFLFLRQVPFSICVLSLSTLLVSILQLQFKKQEELRFVGSDASCTAVSNPLWNFKKLCDISMTTALTPLFLSICPNLPYFSRRLDWLCFSPTKLAQLDGLVKKCWRRKVICSPSSAAAALRGRSLAQHHNKGAWSSICSNEISIKSFAKARIWSALYLQRDACAAATVERRSGDDPQVWRKTFKPSHQSSRTT